MLFPKVQSSSYSNCTDGDIRLVDGSTNYEGRVEICINKAWGTITYFYGSNNEAQTVCNQLGYSATGKSNEVVELQHVNIIITMQKQIEKERERDIGGCQKTGFLVIFFSYTLYLPLFIWPSLSNSITSS